MEPERGNILLSIARKEVLSAFGHKISTMADPAWLEETGSCFVTLTINGTLRGCIGSLKATRPLGQDLRQNARAAAFSDPRFPPVVFEELESLRFEVSLLSDLIPMEVGGEEETLCQLHPGMGLVLETGYHRGTFLPQVWEQLPSPREFLKQLKLKAGLPGDYWDASLRLLSYSVEKWKES